MSQNKQNSQRKVPSALPFFDDEDIKTIQQDIGTMLKSKRLVLGPFTKKFEKQFSEYIGTKYSVAVSSATAALEITLRYCNVKDCEVIVPTNTFISCANAVLYAGGTPVFADMDAESFCMDINDVKKKITSKTKAIMLVHLAGLPEPNLPELIELCKDKGIEIIEDCSHAHGATLNDKKVGTFGLAGCFSLFATKILATGTGGIITTDDSDFAIYAEALRHQGGIGGEGQIEVFDKLGYDWMMNEVTAVLGVNQLSKLENQIEKRIELANTYRKKLQNIELVKTNAEFANSRHVYWKFITILDDKIDRNKVRELLRKDYFIDAGYLYPTLCHMQPIYRDRGHAEGECPIAERVMKHQLTLPINPFMTEDDVQYVVDSLEKVISISQNP
jgi:dTDP-4-amino-4,6-dideoxygalactose transaminase